MTDPNRLKPANIGSDVCHVYNSAGYALFKHATINWRPQTLWPRARSAPSNLEDLRPPYVYALTRDHGRALYKPKIVYVGLSTNRTRFYNHWKAKKIRNMKGRTLISIGIPEFERYHREKSKRGLRAIDEIEHVLIWALSPKFNERKMFTMPRMGKHPGRAWHIVNAGPERFNGTMPREIVYPWMLLKPGRDRSKRPSRT